MSHSEEYTPWLLINLSHEYYGEDICPVVLSPTKQTQYFFKRYNILFINQNKNSWILLKDENLDMPDLLDDEVCFCFELRPQSENYYYVSHNNNNSRDALFSMEESKTPNVWRTIQLNLKQIIDTSQAKIEIKIASISKYYEYICIPKYSNHNIQVKLIEERRRVLLNSVEQIEIPGIPFAFRFITQEKLKLNKQNNYKMQLWEMKENGDILISSAIPNPQPNQYSIIDPKNTIVSYFYF